MRAIVLVAILLLSCAREQMEIGGSPAADLTGEQLVARAVQRYETASQYRDSGTIRTRIDGDELVRGFTTQFHAPSAFELVLLKDDQPSYTIRSDGGQYTISTRSGSDISRDRDTALFGGTGVTSGTSTMLPPLLLRGGEVQSPLLLIRDAVIRGSDTVHGERCTRIEAKDGKDNPFIVWIGEESQLVRRVVRHLSTGQSRPFENQLDYETVSLE